MAGTDGRPRLAASVALLFIATNLVPAATAEPPPNLTGIWAFGSNIVKVTDSGGSISTTILKQVEYCSGRSQYITGSLSDNKLTGTLSGCSDPEHVLVKDCGLDQMWDTPFEVTVTRDGMIGTSDGEHWIYNYTDEGKVDKGTCRMEYKTKESMSATRLDCRPLTLEELARELPGYADELALANQFEGGKTVHWTFEQDHNGFHGRVDGFVANMAVWGFAGEVTSAYRPPLYQAHFRDLAECADKIIGLSKRTDLGNAQSEIAAAANAQYTEATKHKLAGKDVTVAGAKVRNPFVCKKADLLACPHVDQRAVDIPFSGNGAFDLDFTAAMYGFVRPYMPNDPPHWEERSNFTQGTVPAPAKNAWYGREIWVLVNSPVAVLVTDDSGRKIGFDTATQMGVDSFGPLFASDSGPGSHPQVIRLAPGPRTMLNITGVGTGEGPYTIEVYSIGTDGSAGLESTMTGTAVAGLAIEPVVLVAQGQAPPRPEQGQAIPGTSGSTLVIRTGVASQPTASVTVDGVQATTYAYDNSTGNLGFVVQGSGTASIKVPASVAGGPFEVWIDGALVPSDSRSDASGTIVSFLVPPGATAVIVDGTPSDGSGPAEASAGGFALWWVLALGLVALFALLVYWRRRAKPLPHAPSHETVP